MKDNSKEKRKERVPSVPAGSKLIALQNFFLIH
jgi:hypothetical protein